MATQRRYFTEYEINAVWDKASKQPSNNQTYSAKIMLGLG